MKATKILPAAIALFAISFHSLHAQSRRLSVGAELALPSGSFADAFGIGFGGSLRYEKPVPDGLLAFTGTVGFLSMSAKESGGTTETMIPIQVGAKCYFKEQQSGFYGALELGVHLISAVTPERTYYGVTIPSSTTSTTNFSYAPSFGYHLTNLDFGVKYQIFSTTASSSSYFDFRLAYVLGGK